MVWLLCFASWAGGEVGGCLGGEGTFQARHEFVFFFFWFFS